MMLRDLRYTLRHSIVAAAIVAAACTHVQPVAPATATPATPSASTAAAPADPEIYLVPFVMREGYPLLATPLNITRRVGYDNQPSFTPDSTSLLFTSNRGDGQSDIYRLNLRTGLAVAPRPSRIESEYSARISADGKSMTVIRVEADSTQRLWSLSLSGGTDAPMFPATKPVGYYAQADDSTWAMYVLGSPATLHIGRTTTNATVVVARNIGRSLLRIPKTNRISYIQRGGDRSWIMSLDPNSNRIDTLVAARPRSEDIAWLDSTTLIAGQGTKLFAWKRGDADWREVADFAFASLDNITRIAVNPNGNMLAVVAESRPRAASPRVNAYSGDRTDAAVVQQNIAMLAADDMMGRRPGTPGGAKAAQWIAEKFREAGLVPVGDSGTFLQAIPITSRTLAIPESPNRLSPQAVASWAAWDALPAERKFRTANVVGMIPGADATLRDEVIVVTGHYDHLGVGRAVDGDSIYNGADDDASGTIALIEMAKSMRNGPRPKRTIIFAAVTGEEVGGIGTRWYLAHPVRPLAQTVVNLNMEMIGIPDSLAGGFGKAWLTGYERSTMGDLLADNAIPLVPDLRPYQQFFRRSDNYAFAAAGIPAHTISSFGLHPQYHTPADTPSIINAEHMARVIASSTRALRLLADGPRPAWLPGGAPVAPSAPSGRNQNQ